jgi:HEAT repeat protein
MRKKDWSKNTAVATCVMLSLMLFSGCESNVSRQNTSNVLFNNTSAEDLEKQASTIIEQTLASANPQIRTNAIEVVADIPANRAKEFMPQVQRLLKDDFVPVRFTAAVAVGDTRYVQAKTEVTQLLRDKDDNVRLAACYALSKLGDTAQAQQVRATMASKDQQVKANAAFLLGKIGDKSALPLLEEAIKDESADDRVRLNSIEAIARLGDERIYQKLWAMLISAYADDRVCGIRAMGALGNTQARDSIMTMLKDDLPEVRLVAAEQLGGLGETAGEKVVLDALTQPGATSQDQEERERIRTLAALAIGQIKTPALKKFLPELIKNESQFVRMAAAKAVFRCSGRNNIGQ